MTFEYSKLIQLIRFKFGTQDNFAKALGIGRVSLSQRLNNRLDFSQDEIAKATDLLDIPKGCIPDYFFVEKVQKHERESREDT